MFSDDRVAREAMFQTLADELSAAPIQHIGKLLVLWRPKVDKEKTVDEDRKPGPRDVKVLKYAKLKVEVATEPTTRPPWLRGGWIILTS